MYKVLIDSNIFVDFMFHREPFYKDSEKMISLCENKKVKGYVTTSMLMDLHYIFRRLSYSNNTANKAIEEIIKVFDVLNIEKKDIVNSIMQGKKDFEDGVIENCSIANKLDCIVTRNIDDFDDKKIEVLSPKEIVEKYLKKD